MRALPEAVAAACYEFVDGPLAGNPRRLGKPLRGDMLGLYSARRGDYRVIYRIDDVARVIEIVRVDHRSAGENSISSVIDPYRSATRSRR